MRTFPKHLKRFGLVILFFVGFLYLSYSASHSPSPAWYQRAVLKGVSPLAKGVRSFSGFMASVYRDYLGLRGIRLENQRLQADVTQTRNQLQALSEENHRLNLRLGLQENSVGVGREGRTARVVGYDPSLLRQSLLLDRGSGTGIVLDQAVVAPEGVVGRVLKVGPDTSQVLLITDLSSSVDVVDEKTRARGTLVGMKKGVGLRRERWLTRAEYVSAHDEILPGDLLLTSGMDGIFPAGIPVGRVSSVKKDENGLFWEAEVEPQVETTKLEEVLVLNSAPERPLTAAPLPSGERISEGRVKETSH